MKLTKHIANIITSCRMLCSMGILVFPAFSPEFYTMYFLCGFSDMIDGTIARKTNTVSEFGSKLDTVADFVFVVVCLIKLLPMIYIPVWLWIWISAIAVIKIANIAWGFVLLKQSSILSKYACNGTLHFSLNQFAIFSFISGLSIKRTI